MALMLPDFPGRWRIAIPFVIYFFRVVLAGKTGPRPVEICAKLANEGRSLDSLDNCGFRWAIANNARVTEFWEVHELRFYWNAECTVGVPYTDSFQSSVMSTMLANKAHMAFDSSLTTRWSANCRVLLGGCPPMREYLGMDSSGFVPVNFDKNSDYSTVRCTKIYQSPNVTRRADAISLLVWVNRSDDGFEVVGNYHTMMGGVWQKRPAFEHQLWRLWNSKATERPWRVAGLMFYSDMFCTRQQHGVIVSSTSFPEPGCIEVMTCDKYNATGAVDSVMTPGRIFPYPLPSYWMADCHWYNGCPKNSAFIGMDFGLAPVTIRCMRVWQTVNDAYPDKGPTSLTTEMRLQAWDGYTWRDQNIWDGFGAGGWNDTRPAAKSAWRISNFDKTPKQWIVYELGFYEDAECGALDKHGAVKERDPGLAISINPLLPFLEQEDTCRLMSGSCADLAFDKLEETSWASKCEYCEQREAWLGTYFRSKGGKDIKCIRIWQSGELDHQSSAIELSYWSGTEWVPSRHEIGVGGGTWNFRPAQLYSMYRVLSNSITELPWTLMGFEMYNDTDCLTKMQGYPIVAGSRILNPVFNAFDDNELTYWEAACSPPTPGALGCALNSAWIGIQSYKDVIEVRCLRIQQHRSRERQVTSMRSEVWNGMAWRSSATYPDPFRELSGGKWQMLPGSLGSMWRLASLPQHGGVGFGVTELEFFRSADCKTGLVEAAFPNVMPICSAYATAREVASATGYEAHLLVLGDFGETTPSLAYDGDQNTFWADLTTTFNAWVGIDLTTQVTDVNCARVSLAAIKSLQTDYAEIQAWDGKRWVTRNSLTTAWTRSLPMPVNYPSGIGYQRRPAPLLTMWRLQNDIDVVGWEIMEIEFYQFVDCSGKPHSGAAISSLPITNAAIAFGGHRKAADVFDGETGTRWFADCHGVCKPGDAWIGLDTDAPVVVSCFRIIQSGRRDRQAAKIALAKWEGEDWGIVGHYGGFGGETWNRRPAAPDTMWRISLVEQKVELCEEHGRGLVMRSWGVSEIELYADDECKTRLPGKEEGAAVIVSGTREPNTAIRAKLPQFDPEYAFDGDIKTYWAAQCGNNVTSDAAYCAAPFEWIGQDFSGVGLGQPRDVRCFKIHQNRNSRRECCDPAKEVKLERWNGTDWAIAAWRHVPLDGSSVMTIDGRFERMGKCPIRVKEQLPGGGKDYWEERRRRMSEDCLLPLAASVKLLADPLCEKHSACAAAGFPGQCCPQDPNLALSRCCCDFFMSDKVFEDELSMDADRKPIETAPTAGLEYIIIRSTVVLPFLGLFASAVLLFLGNVPEPRPSRKCLWRPWMAMCGPLQRWMKSKVSPAAAVMCIFIVRYEGERRNLGRVKMLLWVALGFVAGGCVFWVLISYVIAEVFIKFTVCLSMIVPFCKSPYRPGDPADRRRMAIMLALPFDHGSAKDQVKISESPLGDIASKAGASIAMGGCYIFRALFDFILMRFAVLAMDLVDVSLSVPDILDSLPTLPIDIAPLTDIMYHIVSLTTLIFQEAFLWLFEGVPRCEGPTILFSGMWLVAVTLVLIRWLNYDLFGIFTSAKNVIAQTRPMFQKTCGIGTMLFMQAGLFMFMQCIMLLFVRALKLVNPMEVSNQQWTCPYGDDSMSVIVGRILIISAAVIAVCVTFLCANGHFLGQDYITREYSKYVDMNLSGLDPDGVGTEGGFIRFDTLLSMIPTTFGIWIDGWNVQGYLIKQRAMVYAEEMELPIECSVCEFPHVPYAEIMRASGMQLSLAYQLAPCGAIIGKACEYLNNPPLFYFGSDLKCFNAHKHMSYAMEGVPKKLGSGGQAAVWASLFLAFFKDMVFPFFVRCVGLGLYVLLVYMTFTIDRSNLKELTATAFKFVSTLAMSKAVLEFLLPAVLLLIFFVIMKFSAGKNGSEMRNQKSLADKNVRNTWPVIGATINGMCAGMGVAIYMMVMDPLALPKPKDAHSILIGTVCGVLGSFVSLSLGLILERCPFNRLPGSGLLFVYLIGSSLGFGWLATSKYYDFAERMIISMGVALVTVAISAYCFWPPTIPRGGPNAGHPPAPAIMPVMNTPRLLSAPMGTVAGVFVTAKLHQPCLDAQGTWWGFGTSVLCGLIAALIYAMATDAIIQKRSSQLALGAGTFLSVIFGVYVEWYVGLIIGTVVGCTLGAVAEHYTMRDIMAETVLMKPGDAIALKPTFRSDGTTMYPGQPVGALYATRQEDQSALSLPTLVTATPRSGSSELKNEANFADSPEQNQQMRTTQSSSHGGKRFGFQTHTSSQSASQTNSGWMPTSPAGMDNRSPSMAMTQDSVGADGQGGQPNVAQNSSENVARQGSGSARESSGSSRGAAEGGLPIAPGSGRQEPRQIASVKG